MRTGPIRFEVRTRDVDRRDVVYALWEKGTEVPPDLPWDPATSLGAANVASLLSKCRTAVLVVGKGATATALLDHALANPPPSCRLYVYAPRTVEADVRVGERLSALSDRVLPRLGFDTPADWLVVDGGRAALLLLGPPGIERRWMVPVDGPLARTLYEAARALFWFHAAREGLPDPAGSYAFRTPLPAPFPNPGNDLALPSGRLVIDGNLPDPVVDAEIRVVPNGVVPGPAGVVFLPPDPKDFATPTSLAGRMARVVWVDTGLPRTAVSLKRVVMDLVEAPVALQIEWPKNDAVKLYHSLSKAAQKPAWQFHPQRRLAEIAGPVLLEGAVAEANVKDEETVQAPDVVVPLEAFDSAQPDGLPEPPPLTRRVIYRWNAIPESLPTGAREADLVRRWRAVDEWAQRQVDTLRQALTSMEGEERGFLDRLRTRLAGYDELRRRRSRLREQLEELGEAPPSQDHDRAADLVRRIAEAGREVRALLNQAHGARVSAEDADAEAQQKSEWEERRRRAADNLTAKRAELAQIEQREAAAAAALEDAEKKLGTAIDALREARRASLTKERDRVSAELDQARRERDAQSGASKHLRKEAARKVADLEQRLTRLNRELDSLSTWSPPESELAAERAAVSRLRKERDRARDEAKAVSSEIRRLEQLASEPFAFKAPQRRPAPAVPQEVAPPPVPDEAPPELGELFEHQGKRFLAVKTWEQVPRAIPVARRLNAKLVCLTDHDK